jgi:hypothetical protein
MSFVAEGPPPQVTIAAPTGREPLVAGDRVSLSGSAIDDRLRPVNKRSLTWYDGRRRIGSGSEVTTRLHAGRHVLRLVARDATGHTAQARRTVRVARAPLRLLDLRAPERVRGGVRRLKVRIAASAAAVVRGAGGHRYRIGTKLSTVELMLPRRPAVGVLSVPLVVRAADPDTRGSVRETLLVLRIGR